MRTEARERILAEAGNLGENVYRLAREVTDELERAAPSSLLYYPPDSVQELVRMEWELVEVFDGIPARMKVVLDEFDREPTGAASREQIVAYFEGILSMIQPDLERLKSSLGGMAAVPDVDFICESTADLKGKCQSALMAIAAKICVPNAPHTLHTQVALFPEKEEEFRRNRNLVDTLREIIRLIHGLEEELGPGRLIATWLKCGRADQYALADLLSLQGALGQLMKEKSRRALYSGDYRRIRWRERLLSELSDEMHTLHASTWVARPGEDEREVFPRLVELALEIAAVIDVRLLRNIIGEDRYEELRAMAVDDTNTGVHSVVALGAVQDEGIPDQFGSLVQLLQDDDLLTFLELLLGNVLKRASLSVENGAETDCGDDRKLPAPRGGEAGGIAVVLDRLLASDNPRRNAFLAVQSGGPGAAVSSELGTEAQQFGWELADLLVPLLGQSGLNPELTEGLADLCTDLINLKIGEDGLSVEAHTLMDRLFGRLEQLKKVCAGS